MNHQGIKIETIKDNEASCSCDSNATSCGCASNSLIAENSIPVQSNTWMKHLKECLDDGKTLWGKIRGFVMFTLACIASPCCTPLIVPVVIALLAGTPVALWMSQNMGLVYGGLTLISLVSFVVGFRWMGKKSRSNGFAQPEASFVSSTPKGKR